MRNHGNSGSLFVLAITSLTFAEYVWSQPRIEEHAVIRIGHVAPTTGQQRSVGMDNENGARLAIEELNGETHKIAGATLRFELVAKDDRANASTAVAVAQQLVEARVVGVVGHLNSGTSIQASSIYARSGIPQISPSATHPLLTRTARPSIFRLAVNDQKEFATLAIYAIQTLSAKAIAIVDDGTTYSQTGAAAFKRKAVKLKGNLVAHLSAPAEPIAISKLVTQLKNAQPDLIAYSGFDDGASVLLREMKRQGLNATLIGGNGMCSSALPKATGVGLSRGDVYCTQNLRSGLEGFNARYRERFGTSAGLFAPYTYDAVRVMAHAILRAESTDPAVFVPILSNSLYRGIIGDISFDSHGDIKNGLLTMFTYNGDKKEEVGVVRSDDSTIATYDILQKLEGAWSIGSPGGGITQEVLDFEGVRNNGGTVQVQGLVGGVSMSTGAANSDLPYLAGYVVVGMVEPGGSACRIRKAIWQDLPMFEACKNLEITIETLSGKAPSGTVVTEKTLSCRSAIISLARATRQELRCTTSASPIQNPAEIAQSSAPPIATKPLSDILVAEGKIVDQGFQLGGGIFIVVEGTGTMLTLSRSQAIAADLLESAAGNWNVRALGARVRVEYHRNPDSAGDFTRRVITVSRL